MNEKQRKNGIIQGIQSLTADQIQLETLELRAMNSLTEDAFHSIRADHLKTVDLSGCIKVRNDQLCTCFALSIRSPSNQLLIPSLSFSLFFFRLKVFVIFLDGIDSFLVFQSILARDWMIKHSMTLLISSENI